MNFLKTKINITKLFAVIIALLILWAVLLFSPVIPKIYYLFHNYNFLYVNGGSGTWIDSIEWEENNLVVKGSYSYESPNCKSHPIHGFYEIKGNEIYLYVKNNNLHFNFLKIVKNANAICCCEENVNFIFEIKNLPKKDYKVILNDFEKWNISVNNKEEIVYNEFCSNYDCWEHMSEKLENPELCFNLSGNDFKNCITFTVSAKEHISYCDEISYPDARDLCIRDLAIELQDYNLCYNLYSFQDNCILKVAKSLKDSSICGNIKNFKEKNDCIMLVAVALQDSELCNNIEPENQKKECQRNIYK